jgi:hypothetical protein
VIGVNVAVWLLRILHGVTAAIKLRSSKDLKGKNICRQGGGGGAQYSSVQKVLQ